MLLCLGIFKHHHQDLVVVRYDRPIPHGSIITWVNDEITIPNVSPTIKCSIIELRYFIKVIREYKPSLDIIDRLFFDCDLTIT